MTGSELGSAQLDGAVAMAILFACGVGLILVAVLPPRRGGRGSR